MLIEPSCTESLNLNLKTLLTPHFKNYIYFLKKIFIFWQVNLVLHIENRDEFVMTPIAL